MRLKLDQEILGLSSLMEKVTHATVKDCFNENNILYFVVATGDMGKAVGKGGVNIKRVESELGKKVRVIEFRDNVTDFIKNIIYPLVIEEIVVEKDQVLLKDSNKKAKSLLIGRGGKHLHLINRAVQRFFNTEVKVI